MKERFKTITLVLLVCTSLFLTNKIWIELPNEVFSSQGEAENFDLPYLLIDMIAPNKYLINFSEEEHTIFYDNSKYELWNDARDSLKNILSSKTIEMKRIEGEEFAILNRQRSISFEFPEQLNTYILAKALEIETPNKITEELGEIEKIYVYLGSEEPFFVFSNKEEHLKVQDKNIRLEIEEEKKQKRNSGLLGIFEEREEKDYYKLGKLKSQMDLIEEELDLEGKRKEEDSKKYNLYYSMRDYYGTDKDVFIPYEMNSVLPEIFMENKIKTLGEEEKAILAESFLSTNIDHIREIEENNGSIIYLYDQKTLKLNPDGYLEYFNPLIDEVKNRNLYDSLKAAATFLSNKKGVPEGVYLSDIEDLEDDGNIGYRLVFQHRIRGIPIMLRQSDINFIEMDVYNNHVKAYRQYMRGDMEKPLDLSEGTSLDFPLGERQMLDSYKVIDLNHEIFKGEYLKQMNNKKDIHIEGNDIVNVDPIDALSTIEDITLAYYDQCLKDTNEELIGVWAIRTENNIYGFDVYQGKLLYKKELN